MLLPMAPLLSASEVETIAKAEGLSVAQLCERAGVAHSTFTRWRSGKTEPTLDVYRRLLAAIEGRRSPAKAPRNNAAAPQAVAQ